MAYHISPTTGRANKCSAQTGNCPFGGEQDHYATKEQAREAYEKDMSANTFAPVRKNPESSPRLADHANYLSTVRLTTKFDEALPAFPAYKLNQADKTLLAAIAADKKVSDEKLDLFIEEKKAMAVADAYSSEEEAEAARNVLAYVQAVRATSNTPSTLPTVGNFDPSTHSLFSNKKARSNATVMSKAIKREQAHGDWMKVRADEEREMAMYEEKDGNSVKAAMHLQSARNAEEESLRSQARVQAQVRELQHCIDTNPAFAATAPAAVKTFLKNRPFNQSPAYGDIFIGRLSKVS